jgi:putative flippase GtrA
LKDGRRLAGEGVRFLAGGVANTLISYAIYLGLQLFLSYEVAYAIAFACGITVSYGINLVFVFREKHTAAKALAFPLVYLLQYGAGALLLAVLVEWLGMPKEVAPLAVVVITLPITFLLTRFVLRSRAGATPSS